jgi:hypothetical protein
VRQVVGYGDGDVHGAESRPTRSPGAIIIARIYL